MSIYFSIMAMGLLVCSLVNIARQETEGARFCIVVCLLLCIIAKLYAGG